MPRLEYFLVALGVSVDQTTNLVSIFNVLEDVRPGALPASIPSVFLIASWNEEEGDRGRDFQAEVRAEDPTGESLRHVANFTFTGRRHRLFLEVGMLPLRVPGNMKLSLHLNGTYQASHLLVVHTPSEPEGVA